MRLLAAVGTLVTALVLLVGDVWLFPVWTARHPYLSGIVVLTLSFTPFAQVLFGKSAAGYGSTR